MAGLIVPLGHSPVGQKLFILALQHPLEDHQGPFMTPEMMESNTHPVSPGRSLVAFILCHVHAGGGFMTENPNPFAIVPSFQIQANVISAKHQRGSLNRLDLWIKK